MYKQNDLYIYTYLYIILFYFLFHIGGDRALRRILGPKKNEITGGW
jgi:hypothetical protein